MTRSIGCPSLMPLALALAPGCSSTPDGASTPDVTPDTFLDQYAAAACHASFACPADASTLRLRLSFGDEATCRRLETRDFGASTSLVELLSLARSGAVHLNAAAARRVFAALAACGSSVDLASAQVFEGSVAAGGSCFRSEECAPETFCDHGDRTARSCPGTCRAVAPLGAPCASFGASECSRIGVLGTPSCTPAPGSLEPRCIDRRFATLAAEDQPCGTVATSATVVTVTRCQPGLQCIPSGPSGPDGSRSGSCQRLPSVGQTCTDVGCGDGSLCVPSAPGSRSGICRSPTVQSRVGDACDASGSLRSCNGTQRLQCTDGTCQLTGTGDVGAPCSENGFYTSWDCNPGLVCLYDGGSSTCQRPLATGTACSGSADNACATGACYGSPPTCQPRLCR